MQASTAAAGSQPTPKLASQVAESAGPPELEAEGATETVEAAEESAEGAEGVAQEMQAAPRLSLLTATSGYDPAAIFARITTSVGCI